MKFIITAIIVFILFVMNLYIGSVNLSVSEVSGILMGQSDGGTAEFIVLGSRLPMAVTALLAGAGLRSPVCCSRPRSAIRWQALRFSA